MIFFFQAEDGRGGLVRSRGLGDEYKRQARHRLHDGGHARARARPARPRPLTARQGALPDRVRGSAIRQPGGARSGSSVHREAHHRPGSPRGGAPGPGRHPQPRPPPASAAAGHTRAGVVDSQHQRVAAAQDEAERQAGEAAARAEAERIAAEEAEAVRVAAAQAEADALVPPRDPPAHKVSSRSFSMTTAAYLPSPLILIE